MIMPTNESVACMRMQMGPNDKYVVSLPRYPRHMGENVPQISSLRGPSIHELPFGKQIPQPCVPSQLGETRREGSDVAPVCKVVDEETEGRSAERFGYRCHVEERLDEKKCP